MTLTTITFWGKSFNSTGMPQPSYRYLVVEDIIDDMDARMVTISALTEPGPMPPQTTNPFLVDGTSDDAIQKAYELLRSHTQLSNLKSNINTTGKS